jgi:hypothetical protein
MKKDSPFYKMHPGSKQVDSPTAFSGKDQSTMSAFNYGSPLNNGDDKKPKDDFDYTPSMPGVTGTTYRQDTTELASDYKRGNKPAQVGQRTSDSSFEPKDAPEVVDTFRDRSGKKQSGRYGDIKVKIKKGSTRFS